MAQIDVSMGQLKEFGETLVRYSNNLANTGDIYNDDLVAPMAKDSGSDFLEALSKDVRDISDSLKEKHTTSKRILEGIEEYTTKLARANRV